MIGRRRAHGCARQSTRDAQDPVELRHLPLHLPMGCSAAPVACHESLGPADVTAFERSPNIAGEWEELGSAALSTEHALTPARVHTALNLRFRKSDLHISRAVAGLARNPRTWHARRRALGRSRRANHFRRGRANRSARRTPRDFDRQPVDWVSDPPRVRPNASPNGRSEIRPPTQRSGFRPPDVDAALDARSDERHTSVRRPLPALRTLCALGSAYW